MGRGGVATGIAEPLGTNETLYYRGRRVYAAVAGSGSRQYRQPGTNQGGNVPARMQRKVDNALVLEIVQDGVKVLINGNPACVVVVSDDVPVCARRCRVCKVRERKIGEV